MNGKISVVIPNFNGRDLLLKNLPSVIKNFPNSQIIVSDDCSTDDSVKLLKSQFPSITLTVHQKNQGFSSTVNDGVRYAKNPIIVLLNTDVSISKNYTDKIVKHFSNPNIFGVGFQDLSYENQQVVPRGRGIGFFDKGILRHSKGENVSGRTLWISGGSCAINLEKFQKLGGFNEIFNPFYWEDIDLSYRAIKSGWEVLFDTKIVVNHYHDTGSIKKHHTQIKIMQTAARNMYIFSAKNITDKKLLAEFYLGLLIIFIKFLVRFDFTSIVPIIKFIAKLPAIYESREKEKKMYKISDTEVINNFGK